MGTLPPNPHPNTTNDNEAKAFEWFRKAAIQGDAYAQFFLGTSYENGRGVGKDEAKAAEWLRKAAIQGYAPAQRHLGFMYVEGRVVSEDGI